MRIYILVNDDLQSSSYKDPISAYVSQQLAEKDQSELIEHNNEKVRMLVLDTED